MFGVRADVVLSNSMSYKNEEYADFLEGHDDQFKKFDLVFSKKIDSEENLNVYDIVLFNNPLIGTTVHRIVGKELLKKDSFSLDLANTSFFEGKKAIVLSEVGSQIVSEDTISFNRVELVIYSPNEYCDGYNFVARNELLATSVQSEKIDRYYKHTITATRESSSPAKFLLVHKTYFDYENDYISSLCINAARGDIEINATNIVQDNDAYYYETNFTYKYEIRGDAASQSDGKFEIGDIYSKLVGVAPNMGYVVRYLSSVWGVVLMIGLGFVIMAASYYWENMNKKPRIPTDDFQMRSDKKDEIN